MFAILIIKKEIKSRRVLAMKVQYQVTLIDKGNHHKPVSTLVNREQEKMLDRTLFDSNFKEKVKIEGIQKICNKHLWGKDDLIKNGYTTCKIRLYDKEKIEQENKERYEKIKEAKYESGEWKRPKKAQ